MSQPAAGGAACRVRLIASVPICMALAVHVSSNGAHALHQRSPGWLRPTRSNPDQGQGQGHSDPDLTGLQDVTQKSLGLWERPLDGGGGGQEGGWASWSAGTKDRPEVQFHVWQVQEIQFDQHHGCIHCMWCKDDKQASGRRVRLAWDAPNWHHHLGGPSRPWLPHCAVRPSASLSLH